MKAEELARDALQELGIQAAEQAIQADEMQTAIRYMNRLARGVDYLGLGWTTITSGSETITIPAYAEEWFVFKLALRMAAQFPPTDQIMIIDANEKEAWSNLLLQHQSVDEYSYPATLPTGSGNYDSGCYDTTFYPETEDNILQENGNNILTEDA